MISFIPFFIVISHQFLIPFSNAFSLDEDKRLIAFMKGNQQIQISEHSMEKYEAYLGIVYYMRMNWKCDKIADEFEECERTECQKYRKYFDLLYEYLYRENAGIPTVKPNFVFKEQFEINGPIIYAVNCLAKISQFYFSFWYYIYSFKLNEFFTYNFAPKLLNEERLNYEFKLSTNEMILQLAIDTANEWQTNENLDGIILKNCGEKFEEYLEEMLKKAEKKAKKDNNSWRANNINNDKHLIILFSKFDKKLTWTYDAIFSEFIKGLATTNFEKFLKMLKEYSKYLHRNRENKRNLNSYDRRMITFGLYQIEKMKKHLQPKFEALFGIMYLMRENRKCANIEKKIEEYERKKCQKYRKYLHILYEYFFRLYVQGKSVELAKNFQRLSQYFKWI